MHRMGYNVGVNKDGGRQTSNTATTRKDVKNENYRKRIPSSNCYHHHKPQHVAGRGDGPGRMALQQRLGRVGDRRRRFWARGPGDGLLSPQITAACNEIVAIGGTCVVPPDDEKQLYAELLADGKKEAEIRRERYAAALEQLGPKPEYPQDVADIFSGGHWNGTFYGGPGNWSVYINGEKRALTDEQKRAKKKIGKARAEWNARAAEIKQNGGNRS